VKPYYQDKWVTIYHGDCQEILPQLDVKVDLVLTDPPWNKSAKKFYDYLGTIQVIKEGGFIAIYGGSNFVPSIIYSFRRWHYFWIYCVLQLSSDLRYFKTNTHSRWRPIVVFSNGEANKTRWCPDVIKSKRVKISHEWQQGIEPSLALIEKFTSENNLVLDPFLGSGTTCYCAKKLNRYSIGIEIEEKYCEIAAKRCYQEVMELKI
jgi:site-specific DNA-methyltransferase (adenine-specific)